MKTNLEHSIGLRVKAARRAHKLSQQQLAEHIERSTETVSNIERGVTLPGIRTLQRLGQVLNIPVAEFFANINTPASNPKRLALEIQIRQQLTQLTLTQLKTASIQIQALVDMEKG